MDDSGHRIRRPRNGRAALSFVSLSTITVGMVAISVYGEWWSYLIAEVALGMSLWSWFSVLHSCGHDAYFRSRRLNIAVGHIASVFCLVPMYPWRYHHHQHHKWTGWRELDPSTDQTPEVAPSGHSLAFVEFCWKYWIPIFSLTHVIGNFWNPSRMRQLTSGSRSSQKQFRNCIASQLFVVVVYGILIALWGTTVLWTIVPAQLVFLLLADPVLLSQHARLPLHATNGASVRPIPDHNPLSRTFRTRPILDQYVFLNFNLHSVHHKYPYVAHYDLPFIPYQPAHSVSLLQWIQETKALSVRELIWPVDAK